MIHKTYSSSEILSILNAELISANPDLIKVKDILIDSRRLITPDNCMFFALVSARNDGHKYIKDLYQKGVRNFVVSRDLSFYEAYKDAHFFRVKNTLEALQKMASYHRKQFQIPIIGITGSNGKTVVKEWLYQLMHADKIIVRSPKSYNSQIGVPLSVWQINKQHELGIFEAGISEPDEMDKLRIIINPTIGIFTTIGQAHDENFIRANQKIGEKLKLFTKVDTLIYNSDKKDIQEVIIKSGILSNIKSFCWGVKEENDLQIIEIKSEEKQSKITAKYLDNTVSIAIPFSDKASIENAIHCWSTMLYLGYENSVIAERMNVLAPIAMRLELKEGINNCTIINDSYNSDFNSLIIALDFLNQQNQHQKKLIILSDILQSGRNEVDLYTEVASLLKQKNIEEIIGIGSAISRQKDKFTIKKTFFENTAEFLSGFAIGNLNNQSILLKGARIFEFEQISRLLQQKVHETVLEINLDAIVNNLNYFRAKLSPGVKVMAMVKAFSYGSGGFEIANILQFHQADYLAVAYADEGVELRKAGINLPIMVMNAEEYAFDTMIKHQLEPEIFSFRSLRMLNKAIQQNAIPQNKPVKVHIKLDTGMNRLGFREEEIDELITKLKKNDLVYIQSVFSHMVASDKPEFDEFSHEQFNRFRSMAMKFQDETDHEILLHILNSAGISRFPEAQFNMVRLGISLYGISSASADLDKLQNVTRLRSVIAQIKSIRPGESISYNRSFIADREMKIGIVSIGYADGLMRNLGNGRISLFVNGVEAKVVGDICMDMCMIDITDIDAKESDGVIVFDGDHPVERIAEAAGTIPYEILSRISRRVKRVYYHE